MAVIIVGLGIKFLSNITKETEETIKLCDKVLYLTNDAIYSDWIRSVNNNCESLNSVYFSKENRSESYEELCNKVISELLLVKNLCVAVYGHPTFLVQISHRISERSKEVGHDCRILPAVSSFDCLIADLNINPGDKGIQMYDATEFLAFDKKIDTTSHLVLFQVAAIGLDGHLSDFDKSKKGVLLLAESLLARYRCDIDVVLYEASQYPGKHPKIIKTKLSGLTGQDMSGLTTMYIPAKDQQVRNDNAVNKMKLIFTDPNTAP